MVAGVCGRRGFSHSRQEAERQEAKDIVTPKGLPLLSYVFQQGPLSFQNLPK
jgi:hypothetical protein